MISTFLARKADRAIADWRREVLRPQLGARITATTLYCVYFDWCEANGRRYDLGRLRTALADIPKERRGNRLYYLGIELRGQHDR
jgi:hypothetical protein